MHLLSRDSNVQRVFTPELTKRAVNCTAFCALALFAPLQTGLADRL